MPALLVVGVFALLASIGVPIGTALGVAAVVGLLVFRLGIEILGPNFVAGIASFPLLAIPFFVLAGVILDRAGLAARIARFFEILVGRTVGGLAMVAVLTCMFWGALSGSGPATTAAVGLILLTPMLRQGYDRDFAAATIANASGLSIVIPPSIAFIIFGTLTGCSVGALFMAGVFPGILIGLGILAVSFWQSWRCGYGRREKLQSSESAWQAFRGAFWALLSPVVILGGIYAGFFTPTEAAVVAVFYGLFVGAVIYRSIGWRDIVPMLSSAGITSAVVLFIVVFAGLFSGVVSSLGLTERLTVLALRFSDQPLLLLMVMNLVLLVLGMFLDAISISYLVLPLVLPVLQKMEVNLVAYGVVFVTCLAIGQTTPPVGVNLFTAANLTGGSVDGVSRRVLPYVAINIVVLAVLTIWPDLSLLLPRALGVCR